jgi:hypothetical protein
MFVVGGPVRLRKLRSKSGLRAHESIRAGRRRSALGWCTTPVVRQITSSTRLMRASSAGPSRVALPGERPRPWIYLPEQVGLPAAGGVATAATLPWTAQR